MTARARSNPSAPRSRAFKPGDRVYIANDNTGLPRTGIYADHALCAPTQLHHLPERVSFAEGAATACPMEQSASAPFRARRRPTVHVVRIYRARNGSNVDLCSPT